jgi:hypothetical protein
MEIKTKKLKTPFLERVAIFDLDSYYTPWVRFLCHFSMWVLFTFLLQTTLFFDSGLPVQIALAFATRSLICNMTVFYVFFYILIPHTLLKNRIILTILSLPLCIIIWIIINHYCLVFIGKHFVVEAPYYKQGVASNLRQTIGQLLSPRNIIVGLIPVFYSISPFFFIKILFDIMKFYSKSFRSERKAVALEVEKLNLEKDFLKAQLNPHFLFNTLNNLYGLSLRKDDQTPEVITQLSEMMRYTLYESNAELVPLEKELQYLQNYVRLEKMRYEQDANIVCEIHDAQVHGRMIAPLLTFTFVENAFKYGLKRRTGGFIQLAISVNGDCFYFSATNDKPETKENTGFGGIGIENARKRLQLLYPFRHTLSITDTGKTFCVELTINLDK